MLKHSPSLSLETNLPSLRLFSFFLPGRTKPRPFSAQEKTIDSSEFLKPTPTSRLKTSVSVQELQEIYDLMALSLNAKYLRR